MTIIVLFVLRVIVSKFPDTNECIDPGFCGNHSKCFNTNGSYYCQCQHGFTNNHGKSNFKSTEGQCIGECVCMCVTNVSFVSNRSYPPLLVFPSDFNECLDNFSICGPAANCSNHIGNYSCTCHAGYTTANSSHVGCIGELSLIFCVNSLELIGAVL